MGDMDDFECDDFDKTLKVIVVGNGNVGKTSMTTRYAKGRYTGNYKKTIGVDFMEKRLELRDIGETVNLMIWDTAGQEEFGALTSRYYKGAGAVIYVFSTTDRDSFEDLPRWQRKVEEECGRITQVLVQNKIDLVDDAAMSRSEIEDMADYMRIRLFRSCVQDNVNVKEVFEHLCRQYLRNGRNGGSDESLQAVADISTLSEAAAAAALKSSQPSPSYERRSRGTRDLSDRSESGGSSATGSPSPNSQRSRERNVDRRSSFRGDGDRDKPRESRGSTRLASDERSSRRGREYDEDEDDRHNRRESSNRERGWERDRDRDSDRRGSSRYDRDRGDRDNYHDGERTRERTRARGDDRVDEDEDRRSGRGRGGDRDHPLDSERDRDSGKERSSRRQQERDTERGRRGREEVIDEGEDHRDRTKSRGKEPDSRRKKKDDADNEDDERDDDRTRKTGARGRGESRSHSQDATNGDSERVQDGPKTTDRKPTRSRSKKDLVLDSDNDSVASPAEPVAKPTPSPSNDDVSRGMNERELSRKDSRSMRESEQGAKDKLSTSSSASRAADKPISEVAKPMDKANLRAQLREGNDSDSETDSQLQRGDTERVGGKTSTNVSESSRVQPSKRRTNGKKTNTLLHKIGRLVYG